VAGFPPTRGNLGPDPSAPAGGHSLPSFPWHLAPQLRRKNPLPCPPSDECQRNFSTTTPKLNPGPQDLPVAFLPLPGEPLSVFDSIEALTLLPSRCIRKGPTGGGPTNVAPKTPRTIQPESGHSIEVREHGPAATGSLSGIGALEGMPRAGRSKYG